MKLLVLFFLALVLGLAGFTKKTTPTPYAFPVLTFFPELKEQQANPVTVEGADLGRHLFYDPILSGSKTMSCATCHQQQHAFSDAPNALSKGNQGTPTRRNTMPLFNLAWYPSFFWDGRAASIEELVFHPVRDKTEMNLQWPVAVARINRSSLYKAKFRAAFGHQKIDSVLVSKAIGQYLRTLVSYQSRYDQALAGKGRLTKQEIEGLVLMNDMTKGDCLHCHTTDADVLGTTGTFSNNGLDAVYEPALFADKGLGAVTGKAKDYGKFKIPSLRNIALTAPYMHDGRFQTLEQVLDFYSEGVHKSANLDPKMGLAHHGGVRLTKEEKQKIIAFLHTLTDSAFISNPEFSNPFAGTQK